jgi:hypothetical protein
VLPFTPHGDRKQLELIGACCAQDNGVDSLDPQPKGRHQTKKVGVTSCEGLGGGDVFKECCASYASVG